MHYELDFLKSLFITVILETLVLYIIIRHVFKISYIKTWLIILAGITASFATLPYLWFIFPLFLGTKVFYVLISEIFAVMTESFILLGFFRIGYIKTLILSLVCNLISYGCGLLIGLV
jgi:hypothetical protein